ncbi:uncharacterized protein [Typha latifolia]|uniref:uncharacterized protein n=2 Tax=Typha TaxID=4732 RepID=UPI003C2DAEBC
MERFRTKLICKLEVMIFIKLDPIRSNPKCLVWVSTLNSQKRTALSPTLLTISERGKAPEPQRRGVRMFATAVRWVAKKPKPKMKPIELNTPPEQTQTITRTIFDIVKEHGPLTIADTWEHLKDVGLRGLTSKRQMKIILRWMRERQKLRLICNHDGPHKQFLYTTWFTNPNNMPSRPQKQHSSQP